jgi:aryl-alcohol dehydrogenase-like predicted oxidoreductase
LGFISRDEFYSRLRSAFTQLEENIARGKIKCYGLATWNGFRVSADSREYHSLERIVRVANEAGGASHGFRFIQLPFNLAMPEAFVLENQNVNGNQLSILEAAETLGITVVASASILQGRVAQGLPERIREPLGSLATDAQTAVQFVRSTPGITTALIGMSRREHVEENLQLARFEPVHPEEFMRMFSEQ